MIINEGCDDYKGEMRCIRAPDFASSRLGVHLTHRRASLTHAYI
jgi:hypothetical protein